jgi:hypothetical protein
MAVRAAIGVAGFGMWLGAIAPAQAAYPTADPLLIYCVDLPPEPATTKTLLPDEADLLGDRRLCTNDPTASIDYYQQAIAGWGWLGLRWVLTRVDRPPLERSLGAQMPQPSPNRPTNPPIRGSRAVA